MFESEQEAESRRERGSLGAGQGRAGRDKRVAREHCSYEALVYPTHLPARPRYDSLAHVTVVMTTARHKYEIRRGFKFCCRARDDRLIWLYLASTRAWVAQFGQGARCGQETPSANEKASAGLHANKGT